MRQAEVSPAEARSQGPPLKAFEAAHVSNQNHYEITYKSEDEGASPGEKHLVLRPREVLPCH